MKKNTTKYEYSLIVTFRSSLIEKAEIAFEMKLP